MARAARRAGRAHASRALVVGQRLDDPLPRIDGRLVPRLALGAAGSAWIVPSVVEVIQAVVDGGLGSQAAVEAPRLRVDETGDVQIEDRFPRRLVGELTRRGQVVTRIGAKGELRYGFVSAVAFGPEPEALAAGADPRRSYAARRPCPEPAGRGG